MGNNLRPESWELIDKNRRYLSLKWWQIKETPCIIINNTLFKYQILLLPHHASNMMYQITNIHMWTQQFDATDLFRIWYYWTQKKRYLLLVTFIGIWLDLCEIGLFNFFSCVNWLISVFQAITIQSHSKTKGNVCHKVVAWLTEKSI